jgi:hypothetical protein
MHGLIERLSTDRGLFLLVVALFVASTVLVILLGFYGDAMRAFWNLLG